jgi:hypothetical protein
MNFLAKTQNDTHENCMNGPFFHEGYSPGMYEFTIKHDFYHFFCHLSALFFVKKKQLRGLRSEKFGPPSLNNPDFP